MASLLLVDTITEHTPNNGVLCSVPLRVNGSIGLNINPSSSRAMWFGGLTITASLGGNATSLVVDSAIAGTNVNQGAGITTSANFVATGTITTALGIGVTQPFNGGGATFVTNIGIQIDEPSLPCTNVYGLQISRLGGGSALNVGISVPTITGAGTNNYGILLGDVTGTGAFAIKTGLGLVQFGDNLNLISGKALQVNATQVVSSRRTGWSAWTGTADRTAHDTGTATLANVVQAFKALLDDLIAHGLVGA
jgi:hypothetical protein